MDGIAKARKWIARVRNFGSGTLSFAAAKEEAIKLYRSRAEGGLDWLRELNLRRRQPALQQGQQVLMHPVVLRRDRLRRVLHLRQRACGDREP
jgi:hypothetical protein